MALNIRLYARPSLVHKEVCAYLTSRLYPAHNSEAVGTQLAFPEANLRDIGVLTSAPPEATSFQFSAPSAVLKEPIAYIGAEDAVGFSLAAPTAILKEPIKYTSAEDAASFQFTAPSATLAVKLITYQGPDDAVAFSFAPTGGSLYVP